MKQAHFRFYEELNELLPDDRRKVSFPYKFTGKPSVKDAIEALGVPHVEVDLILVNGESVDFSYNLKDGDKVSVYPVFEGLDISPLIRLREKPLREVKFILDAHLGKLAKYLRLCGFDTLFNNHYNDPEIVNIAEKEKRIILTRDREMLKNNRVTHGYWVRSQKNEEQLKEVLTRLDLKKQVRLYTRCMVCNTPLEEVDKEDIEDRLQPGTRRYYSEFKLCPGCGRIYWCGSHYEKMKKLIGNIIND
ncbi:MAG: Mut7-C RNAse domain-containing protein [Bacteroidota bacterium]|nr:Mut7-C RNAse domain-containing protein [Bacteroidota bacterium]